MKPLAPFQHEALANANREKTLSKDRVRYCDAKDEIAQAQRFSSNHIFCRQASTSAMLRLSSMNSDLLY